MSAPCYALYKGDEFIDMGSKAFLAKLLNVKEETITFYMSPTHQKRVRGNNHYTVIRVED